ncbi:hypothetical protein E7738_18920 [Pantoea sp. SGAir0430]
MKTHESLHSDYPRAGQTGRGPGTFMQVHENRYIKRAGVAGVRARANALQNKECALNEEVLTHKLFLYFFS